MVFADAGRADERVDAAFGQRVLVRAGAAQVLRDHAARPSLGLRLGKALRQTLGDRAREIGAEAAGGKARGEPRDRRAAARFFRPSEPAELLRDAAGERAQLLEESRGGGLRRRLGKPLERLRRRGEQFHAGARLAAGEHQRIRSERRARAPQRFGGARGGESCRDSVHALAPRVWTTRTVRSPGSSA
ncbi:MAG: hypothetical protein RML56_02325 [Burkholderiales bacterium]|nr:hypothetical protein [Burkholderiales bacterium]